MYLSLRLVSSSMARTALRRKQWKMVILPWREDHISLNSSGGCLVKHHSLGRPRLSTFAIVFLGIFTLEWSSVSPVIAPTYLYHVQFGLKLTTRTMSGSCQQSVLPFKILDMPLQSPHNLLYGLHVHMGSMIRLLHLHVSVRTGVCF